MAGAKKKKKPASNPARGFATTSIASKPRADQSQDKVDSGAAITDPTTQANGKDEGNSVAAAPSTETKATLEFEKTLTPEEFEKQLEETELQTLVEKHAQKSKREATRQATRLHTDRRILRSQAETLSTRKWLSVELMDTILDMIKSDNRSAGQSQGTDGGSTKLLSEEDLTIKLWTLQQTLISAGFPDHRVQACLRYILELSGKISTNNKDMIFGLEESLEWLARECDKEELPDYEGWQRRHAVTASRSQLGKKNPTLSGGPTKTSNSDGTLETPSTSGTITPRTLEADMRHVAINDTLGQPQEASAPAKSTNRVRKPVEYDSDIDPDDLLPVYLDTKKKLFLLQAPMEIDRASSRRPTAKNSKSQAADTPEIAKLQRKLKQIEDDVLFDKYDADQKWSSQRIQLERDTAAARSAATLEAQNKESTGVDEEESEDEISKEAARIGAEMLEANESDDDEALADLFASLPVTEVDAVTGKSTQVVNGSDGSKVVIRDFGKWTGVSPRRVLEEACRARDSSVRFVYKVISSSSFSNRHSLQINWSKSQEVLPESAFSAIECFSSPKSTTINMVSISTPDSQQSEAYVSTTALFMIFGSSTKEDKVFLRLPPVWRELWNEFLEVKKDLMDTADRESIRLLRDVIRHKRDREEEDGVVLTTAFKKRGAFLTPNDTSDESGNDKPGKGGLTQEALQAIWWDKMSAPSYQHMLQSRMQLPMWGFKEEVLRTIDREQVVIICGETGCGKSTQVPAFILEHQLSQGKPCKIYCTEPRRISAISLARRVSEELGERKNDIGTSRSLVGYAIRLESNTSKETRLVYATTGIVMRMLEGSNDLKDITHIVLDEVHERTIDSDFLLIVLRKLMTRRPDLKVVLMSATVDADRFSKYLDGAPVLNVPGRTFPVQVKYLEDAVELTGYSLDNGYQKRLTDLDESDTEDAQEPPGTKVDGVSELQGYSSRTRNTLKQIDEYRIDFDLVAQLIAKIAYDEQYAMFSKAILVFLPGIGEIRQLNDMLVGHPAFAQGWYVYPLHSTIASEDQEAAFLVPPEGTRKIVLATNIAETGITIPDVTCVIDTGKHREMRFDERRQLSRLLESFISRANAKQRRGRAGRVQEGLCFHMFTKHRHDNIMADQQTPELLRLSLQDLAIRVKICKLGGIEDTLGQALDPPSTKNIRRAIDALVDVKALTSAEELTPLGQQLARLPLDVFLGKLILLGSIFKCLDAAITVAAILSSKSPFSAPFGSRSQADTVRLAFKRGDSDLLTVYNAYIAWKRVCNTNGSEYQFCRKNFLSVQTLSNIEDLKGQLVVSLVDSGFLPLTDAERSSLNRTRFAQRRRTFFELPQRSNLNSDNDLITTSVIAWSFYPKLLVRDGKGWRNIANNQNISLHPSSVNKGRSELRWLSYYHIMQAKQFYNAHETTGVEDFAIALLCGDVRCDMYAGVFILDGNRARFAVSDWKTMLVIKILRMRLRDILTKSFRNPGKPLTAQQVRWMEVWQKIFTQEPKEIRA